MGHLENKISQLAAKLYKDYCVGNPQFLNKKAIKNEIAVLIKKYVLKQYITSRDNQIDLLESLTKSSHLTELATQLQYPLLVVNSNFVGSQYGIDLCVNDGDVGMIADLRVFFSGSHKMIGRNCRKLAKKYPIKKPDHQTMMTEYQNMTEEELIQAFVDSVEINI